MQVFSVSLFKIIALFDFTEKKHDLLRNHLFPIYDVYPFLRSANLPPVQCINLAHSIVDATMDTLDGRGREGVVVGVILEIAEAPILSSTTASIPNSLVFIRLFLCLISILSSFHPRC